MTDKIDVRGIEVFAKHGVLESEQIRAQVFKIDVTAFLDLSGPGASDDLNDTLDYGQLALDVREVVGSESHALIEKVAQSVVDVVMAHEAVERVVVTIHKPNAPVDMVFEDISVTVDRSR